ncbi:MAG TPA: hypothetical protein VGG41_21125 [Solirubrobacteraceae bacterium]
MAELRRRKRRPPREPGRSEVRDEAARAALAPLAPGERPRPLLAAVIVCATLGAANAIAYAANARIEGKHPGVGVLAFSGLMAVLAAGMWTRRYFAVLAFEALLVLIVLVFCLFLVEASNFEAVILCVAVIGAGGWLFWKLVRVMGRLSVPHQSSSAGG